jgi:hypothetical protein
MGPITMGVFHVMQGTVAGTDQWFHDPAAQVSAHFGVGKDGTVYQWVDTDRVAWAEAAYNSVAISIEHEGFIGEFLTPEQVDADVLLVRWLAATYADLRSDRAHWFGHGQLGTAGGNHPDCPGDRILSDMASILLEATYPIDPQPQPQTPTQEQQMNAVVINGQPYVYGASPQGHVLQYFVDAQGKWQCVDLTDAVQANNPGSQPYTVQP